MPCVNSVHPFGPVWAAFLLRYGEKLLSIVVGIMIFGSLRVGGNKGSLSKADVEPLCSRVEIK